MSSDAEMVEEQEEELEPQVEEEISEPEDEEQEEWEAPSQEDWSKTQAALAKANKEAAKFRHELKALKKESESDAERVAREAQEAVESKYKRVLAHAEAKSQLAAMGLTSAPERFLKMLDVEELTVNDDGSVVGLKDQLNGIKKDFPEVFKKPTPNLDAGKKTPVDKEGKSFADVLAARMRG